ncbi:DUF4272 domain-containing protein [Culturomica massiliensis]|uniref:DUF4272 domain-containing protein n=1 Tax=Culturomica massiliensis TaxID=1841857 RepID=UPI0008389D8E|nr:DUF4272 domain-containing protein [Culturomica massiliensis]
MDKVNLTLYTVIGDPDRIPAGARKLFQGVAKSVSTEDDRTVIFLQDDTSIVLNLSHRQGKPDFIASHVQGMADYFSQAEADSEEVKQNILRQIACFNCVVGIVFETDDNAARTNYIVNTFFDLAQEVNGFLLYPNMHIYNGQGKLVFSIEGKSDLKEFMPIGNADVLDCRRSEDTEADKQRQARSIALLKEQGIPYAAHLRCAVTEQDACVRSRKEMLQRAAALFAVAVYSEVMLAENPDRREAFLYVNKMNEIYGIEAFLTPMEMAYIQDAESEERQRIQFAWRYECCAVLLWAAGVVEELPYPSEICDVPVIAGLFWQHKGIDDLLSKGIPRTDAEILDAADLTLRYDWACVDARVHGKEAPGALDGGVVMERHYVFDWLTGVEGDTAWDDICPHT